MSSEYTGLGAVVVKIELGIGVKGTVICANTVPNIIQSNKVNSKCFINVVLHKST